MRLIVFFVIDDLTLAWKIPIYLMFLFDALFQNILHMFTPQFRRSTFNHAFSIVFFSRLREEITRVRWN